MTVSIVSGFENVYKVLKQSIEAEMTENGLLSSVETFIPVYLDEERVGSFLKLSSDSVLSYLVL